MRYSASDKTEIIRLVEQSPLPARRTLEKLGIPDRLSTAGTIAISAADLKASRIVLDTGSDVEPHPRGYPQPDCRPGAEISRNSARGKWRCASRTRQNCFCRRPRFIGF